MLYNRTSSIRYRIKKGDAQIFYLCEILAWVGLVIGFVLSLDFILPMNKEEQKLISSKYYVSYVKRGKAIYGDYKIAHTDKHSFFMPSELSDVKEGTALFTEKSMLFREAIRVKTEGGDWFDIPYSVHTLRILYIPLLFLSLITMLLVWLNIRRIEWLMVAAFFCFGDLVGIIITFIVNHVI